VTSGPGTRAALHAPDAPGARDSDTHRCRPRSGGAAAPPVRSILVPGARLCPRFRRAFQCCYDHCVRRAHRGPPRHRTRTRRLLPGG